MAMVTQRRTWEGMMGMTMTSTTFFGFGGLHQSAKAQSADDTRETAPPTQRGFRVCHSHDLKIFGTVGFFMETR